MHTFHCTLSLCLPIGYQLNEDDSANDLVHELDIEFDASTLSLIFSASLEYVGLSADGNFNDEFELGMNPWTTW